MSPTAPRQRRRTTSFPRVSGDEPLIGRLIGIQSMFSPRERGMSRHPPQRRQGRPRFPRVSGDEPVAKPGDKFILGFSPRERG